PDAGPGRQPGLSAGPGRGSACQSKVPNRVDGVPGAVRARPGRRPTRPSGTHPMKHSPVSFPSALAGSLALVLGSAVPGPAGAQSAKARLTIDVATHATPGMAGGGLVGRLAGRSVARPHYGMARHPAMAGRYLDVALYNPANPGVPAQQTIPKGLRLGRQLDLLPPERAGQANDVGGDAAASVAFADGG